MLGLTIDAKKYFDHIDHEDLVREAKETDFSLRLLRSLCAVCYGGRVIQVGMAVSDPSSRTALFCQAVPMR